MSAPSDYCALLCREPDKLTLINSPDTVVRTVETALRHTGLKFSFIRRKDDTCAFKIEGNPFLKYAAVPAPPVQMQRAFARMIEQLQGSGWQLVVSSDVGKQSTNSCLFLRKVTSTADNIIGTEGKIFSFLPHGTSSAFLVDVPCIVEKDIVETVSKTVRVKNHKIMEEDQSRMTTKLELEGGPWMSSGQESILTRKMIVEVVRAAGRHNYQLVTNLNLRGTTDSLMLQHNAATTTTHSDNLLALSLQQRDRLQLICAQDTVVAGVREVVTNTWAGGLLAEE